MIDPVTLSLLLSAGTAAVKGGIGAAQYAKGRKLGKGAIRPDYTIPQGTQDYLKNATAMAQQSQLPGQQLMEEKLASSTGSGIRAMEQGASSSAGLMAGIAGLKGNEANQMTDLNIAGAQQQDVNKQRLQEALLRYGAAEDKAFDINKMQPFQDKAQAAQAMQGAGLQNIVGGIEGLAGAASMAGGQNKTSNTASTTNSNIPFGQSSSTQRLGMTGQNNALGQQSNVQKWLT